MGKFASLPLGDRRPWSPGHAHGKVDRGGKVVPEVEFRPGTETRQEVNKPVETRDSMSAICKKGLGATNRMS